MTMRANTMGIPGRGLGAAIAAAAVALAGCAPTTPTFDQNYGQTLPVLRAQQVANPNASIENADRAITGLDGRAAREAVERYYRSFREPPPPTNTFTIGVGTGPTPAAQ